MASLIIESNRKSMWKSISEITKFQQSIVDKSEYFRQVLDSNANE